MTAKLTIVPWAVKEVVGAGSMVAAAWAYTHDAIAVIGVLLAAAISAAGGIIAAHTARTNRSHATELRDTQQLTAAELSELRAMLDRRTGDRRHPPTDLLPDPG